MRIISASDVSRVSLHALGLDPDYGDFSFPEVIAETVRRIVSVRGPVSRSTAVRLVLEPIQGLATIDPTLGDLIRDVVDDLLAIGDLVEHEVDREAASPGLLMFITMPRYVKFTENLLLLIGSRPDGVPPLSAELAKYIERNGPVRYLRLPDGAYEDIAQQLNDAGIREIKSENWFRSPSPESAADHLQRIADRVKAGGSPGDLEGALIFDSAMPRRHYQSRWRPLAQLEDGLTVLRRPQAYGSDRWSVVLAEGGHARQLVDLPVSGSRDRACDDAWRIIAALDSIRGTPLEIRTFRLPHGRVRLDLDAPPPAWLQRRLTFFGYRVPRAAKALFSFSVEEQIIGDLRQILEERLWPVWIEKVSNEE